MQQTLLIWVVLASTLLSPTIQRCFKANESHCGNVDFAPGSDLAGEGFDITTLQRKGAFVIDMTSWLQKDKSCTLCKNPFMGGQTQKLPVSVVDWRPSQKCSAKLSSSVYQSSESLVSSSSSSIENNWKSDLDIIYKKFQGSLMLAGSHSKLAEYSMEKTKKDKFSFTRHEFSCGYYRFRLSNRPVLHPELTTAFRKLPKMYNKSSKPSYYKLINKFGTHYIAQVTLGGSVRSVTSIKECEASLQGLSVDEVKMCLDVEASASMGIAANLVPKVRHCRQSKNKISNKRSFSSSFSDRDTDVIGGHTQSPDLLFSSNTDPKAYKEWVSSLPTHPDVLSYSLEPLHELLSAKKPTQVHLKKAIKDYILERGLLKKCTSPCQTGVKTDPNKPCRCTCHNVRDVAPNCCPRRRGFAEVTVTVIKATGLYGDWLDQTDGYVKIIRIGQVLSQTPVIWNQNWPTWNYKFSLGSEDITQFPNVKLEVWDRDSGWDDDLLGACTIRLKSGVEQNACALNHGMLYYKVQVKCIPSLAGPICREYIPSPMEAELEKVFVSRNALAIPRDMLLEMGVLLDEHIPYFNHSNIHKAKGVEL